MNGFTVDPAEPAGLATALEGVRAELTAVRLGAPPVGAADLGDGALACALVDVVSNWSKERERLDGLLAAVAGAARSAALSYAAIDDAIAGACRGSRP